MQSLIAAFHAQVDRTPDAIAVTFEGNSLTYRDLSARASGIAARLQSLGCGPDSVVGIALERSIDLCAAVLGVLESGAGYLPLDVNYPADRLAFMLEDARVKVVIGQSLLLKDVAPGPRVKPSSGPEHLVYAIY